jgi:tartrate-resistant acid phosphatase type 5
MVQRSKIIRRVALVLSLLTMALLLVGSGGQGGGFGASACSADPSGFPVRKPATPAPGGLRFAVIGDFGSGSAREAAVASLVKSWNPDFIVAVGDDRYGAGDYDAAVGQFYCDYLKDAGTGAYCSGGTSAVNRFFPALGNHDYSDGRGLVEYLSYFTLPGAGVPAGSRTGQERYYDFIQGPVHFFVVDSMGAIVSRADMAAQKKWLKAGLAASLTPWQLVLLHHAPYSSGTHGSTAAMQWPYQAWGADAVLAGHDHTYERLQIGEIPYFVNGLGGMSRYSFKKPVAGSQVRYDADYGAMLVTASDTDVTYEFSSRTGKVIDSYRQSRPTPIATTTSTSTATPSATSAPTRRHAGSATPIPEAAPNVTPTARLIPPYLPLLFHR